MFKVLKWLIRLVTLMPATPVGAQLEEYRLFPVRESCRPRDTPASARTGSTSKPEGQVGHVLGRVSYGQT